MKAAPWVIACAALITLAAVLSLGDPESGAEARADLYRRAADSIAVVRDSVAREGARMAEAYADSARVWEARTAEARAARADADAREQRATRRAAAVATELVARLDSTEVAMFAAYSAERDSIDAATDAVVEALTVQLATVTADRDALRVRLVTVEEAYALAVQEGSALRAANDALQDRVRGLERESGLVKLGALALVGAAVVERVAT